MKPRQKQPSKRRPILIAIAVIIPVLLLAGIAGFLFLQNNRPVEPSAPTKSLLFSYDANKAPGWWRGATENTSEQSRKSILLFDKKSLSTGSCHVSVSIEPGIIDIKAKLKEIATTTQSNGYPTKQTGTRNMHLATSSGPKEYTLYQFQSRSSSSNPIKEGYAYGFVQLPKTYVRIDGVCDTNKQLRTTLTALEAVFLNDSSL